MDPSSTIILLYRCRLCAFLLTKKRVKRVSTDWGTYTGLSRTWSISTSIPMGLFGAFEVCSLVGSVSISFVRFLLASRSSWIMFIWVPFHVFSDLEMVILVSGVSRSSRLFAFMLCITYSKNSFAFLYRQSIPKVWSLALVWFGNVIFRFLRVATPFFVVKTLRKTLFRDLWVRRPRYASGRGF